MKLDWEKISLAVAVAAIPGIAWAVYQFVQIGLGN
jgi:hypothetical protein